MKVMEIEVFLEKIKNEFEDDFDIEKLTASSKIKDLDWWSSMHMLVVIALIDSEYEVLLSGEELRTVNSVQELYDLVKAKI